MAEIETAIVLKDNKAIALYAERERAMFWRLLQNDRI